MKYLVFITLLLLAAPQGSFAQPMNQAECTTFIKTKLPLYTKLYKLLIKYQPEHRNAATEKILLGKLEDCQTQSFDPSSLTREHSGKIGLILPLTGHRSALGRQFESAIRSFFGARPQAFDNTVIVLDSKSSKDHFHRALAELVFVHKAAIFLGGVTLEEAKFLRIWSETLHTTSLIMHERWFERAPIATQHSFFVSPDQREMGHTLATYMFGRGLKDYAVLYPKEKAEPFVKAVQTYGRKLGMPAPVKVVAYESGSFESLDASIRHLFEIDNLQGREEELLKLMQAKATTEGKTQPDNSTAIAEESDVILPAIVNFKGLVVPDHFKAIRHIVSLLKYYKVPQITLLGQQQWRARELVEPVDPYLNGAVFVDYMDRYTRLPYKLRVHTDGDGFFTSPGEVGSADLWLIARHAIQSAVRSLRRLPKDKTLISRVLKSQDIGAAKAFFGSDTMFDSGHSSHWPNFVYSISGGQLFPLFKRPSHSHRLFTIR